MCNANEISIKITQMKKILQYLILELENPLHPVVLAASEELDNLISKYYGLVYPNI